MFVCWCNMCLWNLGLQNNSPAWFVQLGQWALSHRNSHFEMERKYLKHECCWPKSPHHSTNMPCTLDRISVTKPRILVVTQICQAPRDKRAWCWMFKITHWGRHKTAAFLLAMWSGNVQLWVAGRAGIFVYFVYRRISNSNFVKRKPNCMMTLRNEVTVHHCF